MFILPLLHLGLVPCSRTQIHMLGFLWHMDINLTMGPVSLHHDVVIFNIIFSGSLDDGLHYSVFFACSSYNLCISALCLLISLTNNMNLFQLMIAFAKVMTALPTVELDPPTISMTFGVNDSPLAGRDGTHVSHEFFLLIAVTFNMCCYFTLFATIYVLVMHFVDVTVFLNFW